MNKIVKVLAIIIILVAVGYTFVLINDSKEIKQDEPIVTDVKNDTDETKDTKAELTYKNSDSDLIQIKSPMPGETVGKEFKITGKARGNWYFEASFPIELTTPDGQVLGGGIGQAKGNWMTEDFVEFSGEMQTPSAFYGPAILILKKDNPSGMPENDASVSIPIIIGSNSVQSSIEVPIQVKKKL